MLCRLGHPAAGNRRGCAAGCRESERLRRGPFTEGEDGMEGKGGRLGTRSLFSLRGKEKSCLREAESDHCLTVGGGEGGCSTRSPPPHHSPSPSFSRPLFYPFLPLFPDKREAPGSAASTAAADWSLDRSFCCHWHKALPVRAASLPVASSRWARQRPWLRGRGGWRGKGVGREVMLRRGLPGRMGGPAPSPLTTTPSFFLSRLLLARVRRRFRLALFPLPSFMPGALGPGRPGGRWERKPRSSAPYAPRRP